MCPAFNEEQIACIRLQPDVRPTSSADHPSHLLVVSRSGQPPAVLGNGGDGLLFYPAFHAIRLICHTLAPLTVDGQLRVNRRRITPETYIRRWRQALAQPLTVQEFARQWRVQVVAVLTWPYQPAMAGTRAGWRSPPFETLGELLMHRWQDIDRIDPLQQQRQSQADPEGAAPPALTRLQIDLASDNGARDAWWADDLVSRALLQRPAGASGAGKGVLTRLELRPLPSPHTSGSLPRPLQPGVPA